MRRIVPGPAADGATPYEGLVLGGPTTGRPWIALGMVTSVDGAASVAGRSGALGGEADALAFRRLRDATDVILVGAGTVRAEGYGPGVPDGARRADRSARGLAPAPRLVVVTARGDLAEDLRLFTEGPMSPPPLVVVSASAPTTALARLEARAASGALELVRVAGPRVSAADLIAILTRLGARAVLCEGGPALAGELVAADVVDEVFVTVAPVLADASAPRIVGAPLPAPLGAVAGAPVGVPDGEAAPRALALVEAWEHEGELVLRWRRARAADGGNDGP